MIAEFETVMIDRNIQRRTFGLVVDSAARFNVCALCRLHNEQCQCYYFDDGENGILQDRRIV